VQAALVGHDPQRHVLRDGVKQPRVEPASADVELAGAQQGDLLLERLELIEVDL
jgi:hypothetical protein